MAEVVFTSSSISNTNADLKSGRNVTASFYRSSGTLPPAGSTIQIVNVSFSGINVYISSGGFSTPYGSFSLDLASSGGSQSHNIDSPSASLLNFTGGGITFTVTRSTSGTGNVVNVRSACVVTMTITYVASTASSGSLDKTAVAQGSAIKLTINSASSSYTHSVVWYRDESHTTTQSCASGVTSTSYMIPTSWPTGTAAATLISYFQGTEVGRVSYGFSIAIDPSTVVPSIASFTITLYQDSAIPSTWGVYVKGFSRAMLMCSCAYGSGATLKSLQYTCGTQSQSTATEQSFLTNALLETGSVSCGAKVTNNYNNSASATPKTITVYDYYAPLFTAAQAFRCLTNGTPSDSGGYIAVNANTSFASVSGKNSLVALQAQYAVSGTSTWSTAQAISNGSQTIIGGGNITGTSTYQVRITAIDQVQNNQNTSSTTTITALTSSHVIFCKDGGLNVSFGMEGTRNNALEINANWDIYHGSTKISGTVPINRGGTGETTVAAARNALGLGNTSGAVPIANGGTGEATAAAARNSLGLGNTSGAVPIANGGTGATDAATARANLDITPASIGAAAATHNQEASTITSGTLAADRLPFRVAYGSTTIRGVSWTSVSFSSFSYTPTIVVSYAENSSSSSINPLKTQSESPSGFQVCMAGSSGSGSRTVNWIAIGT